MNATLPLSDVLELNSLDLSQDSLIVPNSNLLLVKKNSDDSKEIIQFSLKE
jgi:hypothetical protein